MPGHSELPGTPPTAAHNDQHNSAAHVLVVDDDIVTNRLLCRWLAAQNYVPASATSGEDALITLQSSAPDVLLLDVILPGMSGLDVLEWVRQRQLDVAVIMITASDTPETAIAALRNNADDYLRKPIDFANCEAILERTLVRLHLRRQNTLLRRELEEKHRLLEAELARAARVQADLLPREMPALPGFELAASCIPAREVGGDFYDWQLPADGVLNLTLGDVTGKGMSAALLMATARAALRAVGQKNQPMVAVALTAHALASDLERTERFVTLFYAQLDTAARRLTYVDAGHGHVFLRRASGALELLPEGGMPLGIFADEVYKEGELTFAPGDVLVIYSDGLIDALPELQLDNAALAAHLAHCSSASDIVRALTSLAESAGSLPDDLTVVALRCCPE
jgi:serine phosphatase RsbU (regulator of sigma subunit)